jgi:DNA-binding NarL/FixJ family response regulator
MRGHGAGPRHLVEQGGLVAKTAGAPAKDAVAMYEEELCDSRHDGLFAPENPGKGLYTAGQWRRIATALDLSDRELDVVVLLFEGQKPTSIANHLCKTDGRHLSRETVRVYMDRLFQKARVADRLGLVLRIIRINQKLGEHD